MKDDLQKNKQKNILTRLKKFLFSSPIHNKQSR